MNTELVRPSKPRTFATAEVVGLLLVLFGIAGLAGSLGFLELHYALRDAWPGPAILALAGSSLLLRPGRYIVPGLLLILIGAWVWARHGSWEDVPFGAVLGPIVLLLIGGSVVWHTLIGPRVACATDGLADQASPVHHA
jgi:hypothetical protein